MLTYVSAENTHVYCMSLIMYNLYFVSVSMASLCSTKINVCDRCNIQCIMQYTMHYAIYNALCNILVSLVCRKTNARRFWRRSERKQGRRRKGKRLRRRQRVLPAATQERVQKTYLMRMITTWLIASLVRLELAQT